MLRPTHECKAHGYDKLAIYLVPLLEFGIMENVGKCFFVTERMGMTRIMYVQSESFCTCRDDKLEIFYL